MNKSPYRSVTRGRRDGEKRRPLLTATTLGSFEAVGRKYANKGPSHGVCRAKSLLHFSGRTRYIRDMLWRNSRGRPPNAPAPFIHPCQPTVAKEPPSGPGWAHELKHDGHRLQIHVRDGRVRLYTMNGIGPSAIPVSWRKRLGFVRR